MNANGPFKDQTDEDEASNALMSTGGSEQAKKDEKVSTTVTEENKHGKAAETAAHSGHAEKVRKDQTEKTGLAALMVFLSECLNELKKIHWPDRQQVIRETMSVIVLVTIITACVLAFDYGIAKAVFEPLDKLARHMGGGIGVHH